MPRKLRVLLLEDRPTDAELVLRQLRQSGYEPEWQRVETEADYLAQLGQGWDIILADYNLPHFDGLRALELVRQRGLDIPFILVSSAIGEDKAVAAMKDGASDCVMKDKLTRLGPAVERGLHEMALRREREWAEMELRKREADLELAQQIGHIGGWESDPTAGTLVWSKEVYRIFGCDPAAFVPTREAFLQLVHADDRARVREAVAESIRAEANYELEHRISRPDGTERVVFEKGRFLRGSQGKTGRLVGTVQDITERKDLERQSLRSQRLEVLGTLAGAIAHDLNNILAPIVMVVPLLKENQTPTMMASTLDLIQSSAQRATAIVRQLMAFGLAGQQVTLHLKHVLFDLCNLIRETFPKTITLDCAEASNLWPLTADPTQLHQVLLNLCLNARDAMPQGGTLRITAANLQVDDHLAAMVANARPGAYVHVQVSDTGTGIPPEHLDKIFDPFFTTKKAGQSTGLGLATVQRVVHGHRGFIQARSRVGHGAIFDVYLPAAPEAVALAKPALPASAPAGQGQLILVVDDEEYIRQVTQRTLLRHGYGVVTACDGAEAVALFTQRQGEIKAVITDLIMPTLDGVYLVRMLARMAPALPVVLSTGAATDPAQQEKLAELRRLGVSVFLNKPYSTEELLQAMNTVLPAAGTTKT